MKKSFFKRILCVGLAAAATLSMTACGGGSSKKNNGDDPNKTNLNIFIYKAGYGDEWLNRLERAFEKAYEEHSFEDGKTGVKVRHTADMRAFNSAQVKRSEYDIFFFENEHYYKYLDVLEDLSDVVNEKAAAEDELTVLQKLDDQQKDYFGAKSGSETHYYALPSYYGNYGIIYNVDLFDEKGYYIAEDKSDGITVIGNDKTKKKSKGPDGKTGVDPVTGEDYSLDDGLPTTYEEFFALCDEIAAADDTPVGLPGRYTFQHLGNLMDSLASDYEGVEQTRLNYDFNGEAENLVVLDSNGRVTRDSDGVPVTEKKNITTANGYDVARQLGKLYGMEFVSRLISHSNYMNTDAFTESFTHTDNQELFLMNGTELSEESHSTAMIIDGPWWQEESNGVFKDMAKVNSKYSRANRKFGWMPLPKATEDKVEQGNVYSDYLNAFVCVKSGLDDATKAAAKEFVKFAASDAMLRDFTLTTGAVKAYKYDMKKDANKLSYFSQGLVNYVKNADVVYKFSSSSFYNDNIASLQYDVVYSARVNGSLFRNVVAGIHDGKATGQGYFEEYNRYFKKYTFWK